MYRAETRLSPVCLIKVHQTSVGSLLKTTCNCGDSFITIHNIVISLNILNILHKVHWFFPLSLFRDVYEQHWLIKNVYKVQFRLYRTCSWYFFFRIYQIQWIAIQLKGNNKEEKMKGENEWKWPKCFGNLGRNLQTQKGKQNDSEESQWQGFSLQMMEIA